tara:strand:- start:68 stop:310 length:243 start_codon:yes stop_codon:yes gene_type:complete
MSHLSEDGVDKLMLHIQKAVNLRAEAELSLGSYAANKLSEESKDAIRDAEYMVYELIDLAVERSKNQGGNIPPATEREDV